MWKQRLEFYFRKQKQRRSKYGVLESKFNGELKSGRGLVGPGWVGLVTFKPRHRRMEDLNTGERVGGGDKRLIFDYLRKVYHETAL